MTRHTTIPVPDLLHRDGQRAGWRRSGAEILLVGGCLGACACMVLSVVGLHISFAIMLAGIVLGAYPIHRLPGFTWGCLFALWQIAGVVFRPESGRPLFHQGYGTSFIWLVLYPATVVLSQQRWRRWAIHLMVVAVLGSLALAVCQFFIGFGGQRPLRVSSQGTKLLQSGGFMPLHLTQGFIMTLMALIFWSHRPARDASFPAIWLGRLASIFAVLFANSRSGFTALLAGFAAWCAASRGRGRWWSLVVLVVGTPALAGWLWIFHPVALMKIYNWQDGRLIIWEVAAHVVRENPWFGVGEGSFRVANDRWVAILYPEHSRDAWLRAPDAHNSLLGLASEHGIPALVFFVLFLASILRHLYRRRHEDPRAWQLGCGVVAALAVGSQFEHYAGHSVPSYAFFIALAFAVASQRQESNEPQRAAGIALS